MPSKVLYAFHVLKNIIFKMYSVVPLRLLIIDLVARHSTEYLCYP